jgi:hypothetical protein
MVISGNEWHSFRMKCTKFWLFARIDPAMIEIELVVPMDNFDGLDANGPTGAIDSRPDSRFASS